MTPCTVTAMVLTDSVCHESGGRVTTFLLSYPRFIHAELLTHRVLSRNSASSRAVPVWKFLRQVMKEPAGFVRYGAAKKGMQDGGALSAIRSRLCDFFWRLGRVNAVVCSWAMAKLGAHKQVANRITEPWHKMTTVVTATNWGGFYSLRLHEDAQPEIRELAIAMLQAHAASVPQVLKVGDWHLPFDDFCRNPDLSPPLTTIQRCVARLARTSYVNFYGKDDIESDLKLCNDLRENGHWSPFEHVCQATPGVHANLVGFRSYRIEVESSRPHNAFDPVATLARLMPQEGNPANAKAN